jgi:OOP family OmpA-OmpF porin
MNFETWTNTIGLLGHTGFGLSFLEKKTLLIKDRMGNLAGVTGQIKLSDRVFNRRFHNYPNAKQNVAFDGCPIGSRGFNGTVGNSLLR